MTFKAYLDGVEIDASRILLPVDQGLTENADGTSARGGVMFDDPLGDFNPRAWGLLEIEEDDCAQPRIWTGWIISRRISRGPYGDGAARIWDCDLIDLNQLLHFTALQKNRDDAVRESETGTARIDWLMGTLGIDGVVFDNGQVANNAWTYDETDYRQQYADDVLRDIVSASGVGRWTSYLYWDADAASGEEVSLFYNDVGAAVRDSTLKLSNVISDIDDDDPATQTTFYPSLDASMERDPESQYGGVLVKGVPGLIYRTKPTTIATMALKAPNGVDLVRDGTYTSERLINLETMNRHAVTYLDWHSGEVDTIDVFVRLYSTHVNLIGAGMRLQVRFTHLPDHDDPGYTWTRVASRTIVGISADRSIYTVKLRLSFKGVLQAGGGDPGGFPLPPTACVDGTSDLVQSVDQDAADVVTLASTPTVGNTLICYGVNQAVSSDAPDGFTDCGEGDVVAPGSGMHGRVSYRIVQSGDGTDAVQWAGGTGHIQPDDVYVEERAGQLTPVATSLVSTDPYNTNSPFPGAPITPTAGRLGSIIGMIFMKRNHGALSADTGWTLRSGRTVDAVVTHGVVAKTVTTTSGTYTPSFTGANPAAFDNHDYGAITIALICDASGADNPPAPGQWVRGELVTLTAGAGTTQFAFADGSLHVRYDIVDQTPAIVSYDGETGDFQMPSQPPLGTQVFVDYQGR